MEIFSIKDRNEIQIKKLCRMWDESVKATYLFLKEHYRKEIAKRIPNVRKEVSHLIVAQNKEGEFLGFMGIEGKKWKCCSFLQNKGEKD